MLITVHFATNRNPEGQPIKGFGPRFNPVHPHELRFGEITVDTGRGTLPASGTDLADKLTERIDDGHGQIAVYPENMTVTPPLLGSTTLFGKFKPRMDQGTDVLVSDRLGESGPKHPMDVPSGVVNLDCSEIVGGLVEHSYYLDEAFRDLSQVLAGAREDKIPRRSYVASANAYRLAK